MCSSHGILSPGDSTCSCYDCWEVCTAYQLHHLTLPMPSCKASSDVLDNLQGDDCATEIDIARCIVNVESGSPLLFGTPLVSKHKSTVWYNHLIMQTSDVYNMKS